MPGADMLVSITLKGIDLASGVFSGVEKSVKDLGSSTEDTARQVGAIGAVATAAGIGIVGPFIAAAHAAASYGENVYQASIRTGLTSETLTALAYAAKDTGVGLDELVAALSRQARSAYAAAEGTGPAAEAYHTLGVNVKDANGNLKDGHTLFLETATALSQVADGNTRAALAQAIFGRGGAALLPVLLQGGKAMADAEAQASAMGRTMSGDAAKGAHDAMIAFQDSERSISRAWKSIGTLVLPTITDLNKGFASAITGVTDWAKAHPDLSKGIAGSTLALGLFLSAAGTVVMVGAQLVQAYIAIGESALVAGAAGEVAWAAILGPIGWIIAGVTAVGLAVYGIYRHFKGAGEAAKDTADALGDVGTEGQQAGDDVADGAAKAEASLKQEADAAKGLEDATKSYVTAVENAADAQTTAADRIKSANESVADSEKAYTKAVDDGADSVATAKRRTTDAVNNSAEAWTAANRRAGDAEESLGLTVDRVHARNATALDTEEKARKNLADTIVDQDERVKRVEDSAAERLDRAQKRLVDVKYHAGPELTGVAHTPAEEEAHKRLETLQQVADAQAELDRATSEGPAQVSEAKTKRSEEIAAAQAVQDKAIADRQAAQAEGEREIARATRDRNDARTALTKAETDGARAVSDARIAEAKAITDADDAIEAADKRRKKAREDLTKAENEGAEAINRATYALREQTKAYEDAAVAQVKAGGKVPGTAESPAGRGAYTLPTGKASEAEAQRGREQAAAAAAAETTRQQQNGGSPRGQADKGILARAWDEVKGAAGWAVSTGGGPKGRAGGGPVMAGVEYIVGEGGPERFISTAPGVIVPGRGGGGGGRVASSEQRAASEGGRTINVTINGPVYGAEGIREIAKEVFEEEDRAGVYYGRAVAAA